MESIVLEGYGPDKRLVLHEREALTRPARFAMDLLEKWGMATMPDGEDSAGCSRLRLSTPEEIVTRAMETARIFEREVERVGWFIELPPVECLTVKKKETVSQ